jgi:hypothetical protein
MLYANHITSNLHGKLRTFSSLFVSTVLLLSSSASQAVPAGVSKAAQSASQSDTLQGTVQATTEDAPGIHRIIFTTPQGNQIFLNVPDDMTAGDTLSGTVIAEPAGKTDAERDKSLAEIKDLVVEIDGQQIPAAGKTFKLVLPANSTKKALAVALRNKRGKGLSTMDVPLLSDPPPYVPTDFELPTYGQAGRFIRVRGPFNGEITDTDALKLAGKEMTQLCESPRGKVVLNTSAVDGLTELELREQAEVRKGDFRNISLRMSAQNYRLLRGETTTLRVEVRGLGNLREEIPLRLENRSPQVMTLGGGNAQTLTIHPADVQAGGRYATERILTGVQPGNFMITATVVPSPVNAQSASAQTKPASDQAQTDLDAQARQIFNDSVLQVGGMLFPKIAQPTDQAAKTAGAAVQTQSCCNLGATRKQDVASIDIMSPNNMPKKQEYPSDGPVQAIYSPPLNCWVISSYSRVVTSANSPYYAFDDAQPPGFKYVTNSEYQNSLESLKSYVGSMNILGKYKADLNLKLEEFVKNYASYSGLLSTSHGQVRHTARLKGRGWPNGRSWYKGYINVTEICCPPEIRDAAQLKMTLKAWIIATVLKLPCKGKC